MCTKCVAGPPPDAACFTHVCVMDAAAVLALKSKLASLKHKGALTTEQFSLLKAKAKDGLVTEQVLQNLSSLWNLRCDGSVEEEEYEEDLQMIFKELAPREKDSGAEEPTAIQRGRLAPAVVSRRPASKWEREQASQLLRSAASGHQHIITSFVKGSGGPVSLQNKSSAAAWCLLYGGIFSRVAVQVCRRR